MTLEEGLRSVVVVVVVVGGGGGRLYTTQEELLGKPHCVLHSS